MTLARALHAAQSRLRSAAIPLCVILSRVGRGKRRAAAGWRAKDLSQRSEPTLAATLHDAQSRLRAAGFDEGEIEAELLLRHALGVSREALYARLQHPLEPAAASAFEALLRRRLAHEPVAYITGHAEFYGLELACTPAALIPRAETELLVELTLDWVGGRGSGVAVPRVVDVGTGNGAIAIAIAAHAPQARVVGIDPSQAALRLARSNAETHGVAGRIALAQGSLLTPVRELVDVIVANLPYVPARLYRALPPELREHEPEGALHAGRRGTALIERLLAESPALLRPGGLLLAEHAWNQGRRLREAARAAFPAARIETRRDLAGRERALVIENT
jgi:release factor glutamine methyltransferase